MAGTERAGLFEVSIYQALSAPGPNPDLAALAEAVDYCAETIEAAADCKVGRGEFRQRELWTSTLPLGHDAARRTRKYATRNAADTVPLVGTSCGSPTGVPFAFSDPGRTLERLDPYDPEHANHTLLICGRSGSGKTMTANLLFARLIALRGARVRDRPRRPLRAADPPDRGRAADRARRRPLPVRAEPVGRPRPGPGVEREGRVPALAAHADDGRRGPGQGRAGRARRGDPRRLRPRRDARGRTAARVDAARRTARDGRLPPARGRPRARRAVPQPGHPALGVLPAGQLRLPARPPHHRRRPTARWSSSTPAAARNKSCGP